MDPNFPRKNPSPWLPIMRPKVGSVTASLAGSVVAGMAPEAWTSGGKVVMQQ